MIYEVYRSPGKPLTRRQKLFGSAFIVSLILAWAVWQWIGIAARTWRNRHGVFG